jgi:hypothetical protein
VNVEKIDKLIERLRSLPDVKLKNDSTLMEDWFHESPCGTVGCIAGEACLMEGETTFVDKISWPSITAQGILGIGKEVSNRIFHVDNWPYALNEKWYAADTIAAERAVMIERLEYLKEFGQ